MTGVMLKGHGYMKRGVVMLCVYILSAACFLSGCAAAPARDPEALCYIEEPLSAEEAARITGIALAEYLPTDTALISVASGDRETVPDSSVKCGLSEGNLYEEDLDLFLPTAPFVVLEVSGFVIKDTDNHGYDAYGEGEIPLTYMLCRKDERQLADGQIYSLVIADQELSREMAAAAVRTVTGEEIREAVRLYLQKIGTVSYDTVVWND